MDKKEEIQARIKELEEEVRNSKGYIQSEATGEIIALRWVLEVMEGE